MGSSEYSDAFKQTIAICFALIGLSIVFVISSTNSADAQSRAAICRSLNAQLASLSSGGSSGGNSAQYRKFDNAVRAQQSQISKTKKIARRGRCTGLGLFNSKSAQCRRITSSLKKMEANLRGLKRTRAKHAPKQAGSARKRNQILRRIKQNRCKSQVTTKKVNAKQPKKSKRKTLLEQIFGVKTYRENGQRKNNENQDHNNQTPVLKSFGTYRTLCVRKTDGYYFPISFSTVKDRFEQDQATCQAMCPGTNVELYHHKMPTEDSEEMISYLTGKAYAEEPFAFAYRKSVDLEQKCRFATENRIQGVETASNEISEKPESNRIGTPVWREDPTLSPDDHDIRKEGLTLAEAKAYLLDAKSSTDAEENQLVAENRKVRIVGPAFFPVQ